MGTIGDRIALEYLTWTGGPEGDAFAIDKIHLAEVDAAERVRAVMLFDPDDRAAAFVEALERFAAGEAAATGGCAPYVAFTRAVLRHDWDAARRILAADFVLVDQRTLGLGTLDREQWIGALRALADLAPDLTAEVFRVFAWNRHGFAAMTRQRGTVPDGGPFENVFVTVYLTAGDHILRCEAFNLADTEWAVARFEELCGAAVDGGIVAPASAVRPR